MHTLCRMLLVALLAGCGTVAALVVEFCGSLWLLLDQALDLWSIEQYALAELL